jgi:type I restriction enzyme S subunit
MSFPRYPKYKPSGVEWLGAVPEGWEVTALKRGYAVTLGKMLQPEQTNPTDTLWPYLRAANIQWNGVDASDIKQMWLSPRDRDQLGLIKGDLLVSEGGDVGRSCVWQDELEECYFQNSVNRVRSRRGNSNRYLYYWMSVIKDKGYVDVLCNKSTIAHFTAEKVAAVPVPFPPLPEQTAIAEFLDRERGKIDELVAEQRRLMELLKEKRQAVISHAVTKGLNPNAPMKPSRIEWLGDVPDYWETRTIAKASSKITNGYVGPTRDILVESGTPYIQATHIKKGRVNFDDGYYVTPEWSKSHAKSILAEGDVLIVQTGAGTGDVGLVSCNEVGFNCHALIIVVSLKELLSGAYLAAVLQSEYGHQKLESIQTGGMHPHLNCGNVKFVEIPLPPVAEQTAIIKFLETETSKFDALTAEAQRAIDLLQERRTALISAAVTGQIDVRQQSRN